MMKPKWSKTYVGPGYPRDPKREAVEWFPLEELGEDMGRAFIEWLSKVRAPKESAEEFLLRPPLAGD